MVTCLNKSKMAAKVQDGRHIQNGRQSAKIEKLSDFNENWHLGQYWYYEQHGDTFEQIQDGCHIQNGCQSANIEKLSDFNKNWHLGQYWYYEQHVEQIQDGCQSPRWPPYSKWPPKCENWKVVRIVTKVGTGGDFFVTCLQSQSALVSIISVSTFSRPWTCPTHFSETP